MLRLLKDTIKKSKIFWIYRHFFSSKYWDKQLKDKDSIRRSFYYKFILDNNLKPIIFEFGCGSGANFHASNNLKNLHCLGFDISVEAISVARKYQNFNWEFTNNISSNIFLNFLSKVPAKSFSLAIYDRVLYMLSKKEIIQHFEKYGRFFNYLIIDDFVHFNEIEIKSGGYVSKNYKKMLSNLNFKFVKEFDSNHDTTSNDPFFRHASKILIFKKLN